MAKTWRTPEEWKKAEPEEYRAAYLAFWDQKRAEGVPSAERGSLWLAQFGGTPKPKKGSGG